MTGRHPRHLPALVLVTLLWGCAAEGESVSATQAELTVCAQGATTPGIDVSHWQGNIDWDQVKASGVQFAFIRVSDGTGTMDKQFARNWAEAKRVGILRGAYQFFRPKQDPNVQADIVLQKMGADMGELPAVIDIEAADGASPAQIVGNMAAWMNKLEAATGKKPIVYTGLYFWRDSAGSSDAFRDYPLWVAQYGRQCPDIPAPWGTWAIWQTGSTGTVPGIAGNVDMNVFNGDVGALAALANGMPECGDGYCNGGETGATCEQDCPICKPVGTTESRIIDNGDVCQELGGDPTYWRTETTAGVGGSLRWTYTTNSPAASNYCAWHLEFNAAGKYRVEVHAPQPFGTAKQTQYEIGHNGEVANMPLDQSTMNGWVTLGDFDFAMGANQYVLLGDNTGESRDMERKLVCDALRVTAVGIDPSDDPNQEPPRGTPTDGYMGGAGASGSSCAVSRGPGNVPAMLFPMLMALGVLASRRRRTR